MKLGLQQQMELMLLLWAGPCGRFVGDACGLDWRPLWRCSVVQSCCQGVQFPRSLVAGSKPDSSFGVPSAQGSLLLFMRVFSPFRLRSVWSHAFSGRDFLQSPDSIDKIEQNEQCDTFIS